MLKLLFVNVLQKSPAGDENRVSDLDLVCFLPLTFKTPIQETARVHRLVAYVESLEKKVGANTNPCAQEIFA